MSTSWPASGESTAPARRIGINISEGDAVTLGLVTDARRGGHSRRPALAAGHRPVPQWIPRDQRLDARIGVRHRRTHHGVRRVAVEPGRPWPRRPVAAADGGGPLLPFGVSEYHVARRRNR